SRQRSTNAAPGVRSTPCPERESGVPRIPAAPARVVHLGKDARGGDSTRGDSRVPAGEHRAGQGGVMALIRVGGGRSEAGGQNPEVIAERADVTTFLARHGIDYERWTPEHAVAADAPADEVLRAYAGEIDALKARGGYVTADVIDVKPDTPNLD